MSGRSQDDRSVDRLLEAAVRARRLESAPAGPSCLDAETIAAWSDGALSPAETRAVEAHLSTCVHCLETAAVFAKSAPPPLEPAAPWWRRAHVRWLGPALAGAGALTLLIWTRGPDVAENVTPPVQQEQPQPDTTLAREEAARESSARPTPPAGPQPRRRADEKTANTASGARAELADQAARAELERAAPKPIPAGPPVGVPLPATGGVTLAPPPPPPPPPVPPAAVSAPAPPPSSLPRGQVAGAAQKEQVAQRMAFRAGAETVVTEFAAMASEALSKTAAGRSGGRGGGGGRAGGAVQQDAAAPAPPLRWRVLSTGVVMKSPDGGRTWTNAGVDPALQITGGAAPAPTVCWLIGRSGVVLVTTDGVTFARAALSIATDVTGIRAQSGLEATITTASGLTMTTSDGGRTWR